MVTLRSDHDILETLLGRLEFVLSEYEFGGLTAKDALAAIAADTADARDGEDV